MIYIDIVDDSAADCEAMLQQVQRFCSSHVLNASIRCFCSGEELLESYCSKTDLVILDIQMEGQNGIEIAREIRSFDSDVLLLFITNLAHYALEGYSVNACDFILKPIDYLQVSESLTRILQHLQKRNTAKISIKQKDGMVVVDPQRIIYIETYGRKLRIRLDTDALLCTGTLTNLEQQLDSRLFFRCHNAYLVNLKQVGRLMGSEVEVGGESIPLSKHRRKQFIAALSSYLGDAI